MPWLPTHAFMEMLMFFAIFACYLLASIRQRTLDPDIGATYQNYAPFGRWLLIIMYFFGTFHKLNPVFLNPISSCAIPFLEGLPIPFSWQAQAWLQYTAIYGTVIIELAAMLMLLTRRFKYYGMLVGMTLHLVIGISAYGTLAHFSTFALALHCLFLPDDAFSRFNKSVVISSKYKTANTLILATTTIVILQLYIGMNARWLQLNLLFGLYAGLFMAFVLLFGKLPAGGERPRLMPKTWIVNLLSIAFFIHCCGPIQRGSLFRDFDGAKFGHRAIQIPGLSI